MYNKITKYPIFQYIKLTKIKQHIKENTHYYSHYTPKQQENKVIQAAWASIIKSEASLTNIKHLALAKLRKNKSPFLLSYFYHTFDASHNHQFVPCSLCNTYGHETIPIFAHTADSPWFMEESYAGVPVNACKNSLIGEYFGVVVIGPCLLNRSGSV